MQTERERAALRPPPTVAPADTGSPGGLDLGARSTAELVQLLNEGDRTVPNAVGAAGAALAGAIDAIVERLRAGGRLVYVGAGTSGGLAALDAEECEATFSTEPGRVVAVVAGAGLGSVAERTAAEDDARAGAEAVAALAVDATDAVVGVSASGSTPFVVGALERAAETGALTVAIVSARESPLEQIARHAVVVPVGPELIEGSTRLKAGTAQKLVLNAISTVSMIRLGRTLGTLMVDVNPANRKLRARAVEIVAAAAGVGPAVAEDALGAAGWNARVAIVSLLAGVDAAAARARLDASGGDIEAAVAR